MRCCIKCPHDGFEDGMRICIKWCLVKVAQFRAHSQMCVSQAVVGPALVVYKVLSLWTSTLYKTPARSRPWYLQVSSAVALRKYQALFIQSATSH